ncbi:hypothetical protein BCR43DRAFT_518255 [Syncephalastrum racemosum]|uniref:Uncharacterized protein n=1 Tax=Syncephalastrum racemosum TaxID=13706 RepID=A0A1X2H391_SYNRA|nr:hypothetical protein BCR43DRAFT_518255 [Syncephalastrum racemosum]
MLFVFVNRQGSDDALSQETNLFSTSSARQEHLVSPVVVDANAIVQKVERLQLDMSEVLQGIRNQQHRVQHLPNAERGVDPFPDVPPTYLPLDITGKTVCNASMKLIVELVLVEAAGFDAARVARVKATLTRSIVPAAVADMMPASRTAGINPRGLLWRTSRHNHIPLFACANDWAAAYVLRNAWNNRCAKSYRASAAREELSAGSSPDDGGNQ